MPGKRKGVKGQSTVRSITYYFKPYSADRLHRIARSRFAGGSSMNSHPQKGQKMINIFHPGSTRESEDVQRHSFKSKVEHVSKNPYKRSPLAASRQSRDPVRFQDEAQVSSSEGLKPFPLASSRAVKGFFDSTLKKPGSDERLSTTPDSKNEHTSKLRSLTSGQVPDSPSSRGSKSISARKELNFNPSERKRRKSSTSMEAHRPSSSFSKEDGSSVVSGIIALASPRTHDASPATFKTNMRSSFSPMKGLIPSDLSRCPIDAVRSKKGPTGCSGGTRSHEGTKPPKIVPYNGTLPVHKKSPSKPAPLLLLSPGKRVPVVSGGFQSTVTSPPSPVKKLPGNSPGEEQSDTPLSPLLLAKKSPESTSKKKLFAPSNGPSSPHLVGKKPSGTSCNLSSPALAEQSASPSKLHCLPPLFYKNRSKDKSPLYRKRSVDERTKSPGELSSPLPSKKACKDGCLSSSQQTGKKPSNKSPQKPGCSPPSPSSTRGKKLVQKSLKDYPSTPDGSYLQLCSPLLSSSKLPKKSPDEGQKSSKKKQSPTLDKGPPSPPSASHKKTSLSKGELTPPLPSEKSVPSEPSTKLNMSPVSALSSVFSPTKKSPRSPLSLNKSLQARGRTITYSVSPVIKIPRIPSPVLRELRSHSSSPAKSASPVSESEKKKKSFLSSEVTVQVKMEAVETARTEALKTVRTEAVETVRTETVKTEAVESVKTEAVENVAMCRDRVVTAQETKPEQKVKVERCDLDSTTNTSEPCLGQYPGEAVLPTKRKMADQAQLKKKRKKKRPRKDSSLDIIELDSPSEDSKHTFVSLVDDDVTSYLHPPSKKPCVVDLTLSSPSSSSGNASVIDLTTILSENDSDVDLVGADGKGAFESPATPPLRDPDLTPELVITRHKLISTTPISDKSARSAPRKSMFVRKTLFQFPSPSEREITPPLDKDLVTPTLPMFDEESNLLAGGATSSDDVSGSVANSNGVDGGMAASPKGVAGSLGPEGVSSSGEGDGGASSEDVLEGVVPGGLEWSGEILSRAKGRAKAASGAIEVDDVYAGATDVKDLAESKQLSQLVDNFEEYVITLTKVENTRFDSLQHLKEKDSLQHHLKGEDSVQHHFDPLQEDAVLTDSSMDSSMDCTPPPNLPALRPSPPPPPAVDRTQPCWKATPIAEVSTMMSMRGIARAKASVERVQLLSSAQDTQVSTKLDLQGPLSSYHLCSVIEHLNLVTTPSRMPKASNLSDLWEMLLKAKEPDNLRCQQNGATDLCRLYLGQLLSIHPPGQHSLVDQQYCQFIGALCEKEISFGLWHHLKALLSSQSYLGTFLVDLLVADFWGALTSSKSGPPLFMRVFWPKNSSGGHVTSPIRELVQEVVSLVLAWNQSMDKAAWLRNLMDLLFLAGTVCTDALTTELLLACNKFPREALLCFASYVHSVSLYRKLANNLTLLEETHDFYASLFCPSKGTFSKAVRKVALITPAATPQLPMKCLVKERSKSASFGGVLSLSDRRGVGKGHKEQVSNGGHEGKGHKEHVGGSVEGKSHKEPGSKGHKEQVRNGGHEGRGHKEHVGGSVEGKGHKEHVSSNGESSNHKERLQHVSSSDKRKCHKVRRSSNPCSAGEGHVRWPSFKGAPGSHGCEGKGREVQPASLGSVVERKGQNSKRELWPSKDGETHETKRKRVETRRPRAVSLDCTAPPHRVKYPLTVSQKPRRESLSSVSGKSGERWDRHHSTKHDHRKKKESSNLPQAKIERQRHLSSLNSQHSHFSQQSSSNSHPTRHSHSGQPSSSNSHPTQHSRPRQQISSNSHPTQNSCSRQHSSSHSEHSHSRHSLQLAQNARTSDKLSQFPNATSCPTSHPSLHHPSRNKPPTAPPRIRCESTCMTSSLLASRPHPSHHHSHPGDLPMNR